MLWWVRQFYKLPPTDPRYLDLTDEQIALDIELYLNDNPQLRKEETYRDPDYDRAEEDALSERSNIRITVDNDMRRGSSENLRRTDQHTAVESPDSENDWEEVEIPGAPVDETEVP